MKQACIKLGEFLRWLRNLALVAVQERGFRVAIRPLRSTRPPFHDALWGIICVAETLRRSKIRIAINKLVVNDCSFDPVGLWPGYRDGHRTPISVLANAVELTWGGIDEMIAVDFLARFELGVMDSSFVYVIGSTTSIAAVCRSCPEFQMVSRVNILYWRRCPV